LSEVAVAQYIPGLAVAPALARELQFANAVRVLARTERGAAAADNTTPLYRAVMNSELDDIVTTGVFRNPAGIEQKYFSATAEGAASYARQAFGKMGDTSPYTIIRTDAPTSLLPSIHSVDRGVPAILVPTNALPKLSPPQVLPHSPYPR